MINEREIEKHTHTIDHIENRSIRNRKTGKKENKNYYQNPEMMVEEKHETVYTEIGTREREKENNIIYEIEFTFLLMLSVFRLCVYSVVLNEFRFRMQTIQIRIRIHTFE